MSLNRIRQQFAENIEHSMKAAEMLPESLLAAGDRLLSCLLDGGRIFSAGSASGAELSALFAGLLLRGQGQRPPLPAWDLTASSSADHQGNNETAALNAFGQRGDILLLIQPQQAIAEQLVNAAHDRDMTIVLIAPIGDKHSAAKCRGLDIPLIIPADNPLRVSEIALLVIHALCDHIEQQLFGDLS
ncbi:MAG: phosphoheptose isomerase [Alcanivoracaceae bacterium]|jgi:D-sedoheptulose 7-phosphate isomerase|nr:phosphoheptose isomerase [Alcanivoracaceae bacterium]